MNVISKFLVGYQLRRHYCLIDWQNGLLTKMLDWRIAMLEQGFAADKTLYYLACPEKFVEVSQVLDQLCSDYRDEMGHLRSNPLDTPLFTALSYYAGTLATYSIQLIVALEKFKHNTESIKWETNENVFADVMEIVRRYQPIKK